MNTFQACHSALIAGRWSEARRLLDNLAREPHADLLLASYSKMDTLRPEMRAVIADRIELANATAGR